MPRGAKPRGAKPESSTRGSRRWVAGPEVETKGCGMTRRRRSRDNRTGATSLLRRERLGGAARASAVLLTAILLVTYPLPARAHHDAVVDRSGRETYELVSVSSAGTQGDGSSGNFSCEPGGPSSGDFLAPSISDGGRYVAFASAAEGLHPADTNGSLFSDVFVRDLKKKDTELISAYFGDEVPPLPPGAETGSCVDMSFNPSISASGRFVAFASRLPLTGVQEANPQTIFGWKVFVHDRKTNETELVSITNIAGNEVAMVGDSGVVSVDISDTGRYVVFDNNSPAVALQDRDPLQPSLGPQVHVHDRRNDTTTLVSRSSDGTPGNAPTNKASLSANGRYAVFESGADNLVDNDFNALCPSVNCGTDVFLHDLRTEETELISIGYNGTSANGASWVQCCSSNRLRGQVATPDGRFVVFHSVASDITPAGAAGLFVRDRKTRRTERVHVNSTGTPYTTGSNPQITDDGRYVLFTGQTNPGITMQGPPCDPLTFECSHIITGQFVFDREIGQLTYVSSHEQTALHYVAEPNDRGRYYAFASNSSFVRADTDEEWDVYIRDLKRIRRGVGTISSAVGVRDPRPLQNEGMVTVVDSPQDSALSGVGEIIGARLIHRPDLKDLFATIDVDHMVTDVGYGIAGSPLFYGLRFKVGATTYEARAASVLGGSFGLFDCTRSAACTKVADLKGGYGTTGMRVVLSLPLEKIELQNGGEITDVEAFSAMGNHLTEPKQVLDRASIS